MSPSSISVLQGNSQAFAATMAQTVVRMDESALIRAAQTGDQHAFEQLVRLYDQPVLRLAMNLFARPKTPTTSIRKRSCGCTAISTISGSTAAFIPGFTGS